TAAEVRAAFTKHDGNLGGSGAVAWLFERRGVILVDAERADEDELTMAAAEGGADDVELDGSSYRVTAAPESLTAVREAIAQDGLDLGQADDLRDELAAVERAEASRAAGTYGLSIESGKPIPDERLEALPAAERTVEEERA